MAETRKRNRCDVEESDRFGRDNSKSISVRKVDIPTYLHTSEFYRSLHDDEANNFLLVPAECMKLDDVIFNGDDLCSLLMTLRYWVADCICDSVVEYALSHSLESIEYILCEFYQDLPDLVHLKSISISNQPFMKAIECGVLNFVQYFRKIGCSWPNDTCDVIVKSGNIELLKYAVGSGCTISKDAVTLAASCGRLDCLQFLYENGGQWDESATTAAAESGHLPCLKFAHEHGCPWLCSTALLENEADDDTGDGLGNICTIAAAHANLDCLQYAHTRGVVLQHRLIRLAAQHADGLKCLQYAHQNGCSLNDNVCLLAAAKGSLECLKYLGATGCALNQDVCDAAARSLRVDTVLHLLSTGCPPSDSIWSLRDESFTRVLQCFVQRGLPWSATPEATARVAGTGNLEHLKSLIENGCPWHPRTTVNIITQKHLEMLKYAHLQGCPWHPTTCFSAAHLGALECLKYAHTHGAEIGADVCAKLMAFHGRAFQASSIECFKYVHQHSGCLLLSAYSFYAARSGYLELLKYLFAQGCEWDTRAAAAAAQNGHADCLEFLLCHGCSATETVKSAAKPHQGCTDVVERHLV